MKWIDRVEIITGKEINSVKDAFRVIKEYRNRLFRERRALNRKIKKVEGLLQEYYEGGVK